MGIRPVQEGEILITAANGSPRLVGKRAVIRGLTGKTVHGGFMLCAHADQPDFVAALMGSNWYRRFLATGVAGGNGSIGNLDKVALESEIATVPSVEEQRQIGALFSCLDSLITLHQRKQGNVWHRNGAWNGLTNSLVFRTPLAASSPSCTPTVARMDASDGADRVAAGSVPMAQTFVCAPGDASAAEPSERPFSLRGMPRAPGGDRLEP